MYSPGRIAAYADCMNRLGNETGMSVISAHCKMIDAKFLLVLLEATIMDDLFVVAELIPSVDQSIDLDSRCESLRSRLKEAGQLGGR